MTPKTYRWLLVTYPGAWRKQNGAVVLDTLLSVHAETGRTAPRLRDRIRFAVDGVRVRLADGGRRTTAPFTAASGATDVAPFHLFDQSNGAVPERLLDQAEQARANEVLARGSGDAATALSPVGLNVMQGPIL